MTQYNRPFFCAYTIQVYIVHNSFSICQSSNIWMNLFFSYSSTQLPHVWYRIIRSWHGRVYLTSTPWTNKNLIFVCEKFNHIFSVYVNVRNAIKYDEIALKIWKREKKNERKSIISCLLVIEEVFGESYACKILNCTTYNR